MAEIQVFGTTMTVYNGTTNIAIGGLRTLDFSGSAATPWATEVLADSHAKFVAGIPDEGDLNLTFIMDNDDAGQVELRLMYDTRIEREFIVTFSSGTLDVETFDGVVTALVFPNEGKEGLWMMEATVKISGQKIIS